MCRPATKFTAIGYRNGEKVEIRYDVNDMSMLLDSVSALSKENSAEFWDCKWKFAFDVTPPGCEKHTKSVAGMYFFLLDFFDKEPAPLFEWNGKSVPEIYAESHGPDAGR